jgi:acyl carrier protein
MKEQIIEIMKEVAETTDCELVAEITDETVLLESGLDSLGFAILVARLEEELGFDPFSEMDEAVYPSTFAQFVDVYSNR